MRLYKFFEKHFALLALRERRLKVARLAGLNDPFEMLAFDFSDRGHRLAITMTMSELNERAGWVCCSQSWSNPVVWAHYADQHRGLCLGFEVRDELVKPITYSKVRRPLPDVVGIEHTAQMETMQELLFTKFEDWRYEDEVRMSVKLDKETEVDGLFFIDWGNDLRLAEIIVGLRGGTCRRELEQALGTYPEPVAFVRAEAALDSFAVVASADALRNHDDLTYYLRRGRILHPTEFVRDGPPEDRHPSGEPYP